MNKKVIAYLVIGLAMTVVCFLIAYTTNGNSSWLPITALVGGFFLGRALFVSLFDKYD